ncbi:ATP-dependent RNA helicase DDX1-like, partial [Callospermophilus lateralis]
MAAFSEMGVMPEIAQAVEEMDWLLPTDIQAESIPLILGGGDVLMAAETGSGKTGAFSIPVIQIVYETLKDQQEGKKGKTTIKTGASVLNKWQMNPYDRGSAFGRCPFKARTTKRLQKLIVQASYDLPRTFSRTPAAFIQQMLTVDSTQTPTLEEVMGHPWLSQ